MMSFFDACLDERKRFLSLFVFVCTLSLWRVSSIFELGIPRQQIYSQRRMQDLSTSSAIRQKSLPTGSDERRTRSARRRRFPQTFCPCYASVLSLSSYPSNSLKITTLDNRKWTKRDVEPHQVGHDSLSLSLSLLRSTSAMNCKWFATANALERTNSLLRKCMK